ncbi:hypothetical protein [Paenibacillus sacheonensis]|uniref:Uncharacterized protein n=1 Tax=Paenibacillus sacheonensis TaxID=742054 RepID=A0A7X4YQQ7_9BACL|nr:hypothetical protein [Paenibacillus sacheonensis]MBM7567379.1 hypothetical protein [Paenibacillus sacheonensis]NBC69839.1 hypothetical protein [Paenibacillus sacheonensis]
MTNDYAKTALRDSWLRHPVLGDPSFDTFERIGDAVHTSQPPFEWAVNGSLFRDPKDGAWYYYAGLYPLGYALIPDDTCHIVIYRSTDEGASWTSLGRAFEPGFMFEGHAFASDICPDAVAMYDELSDTYWLSYDWCSNNSDWTNIFNPEGTGTDSGAALAWSKSPAGPFHRLPRPHISNVELSGHKGRFKRMYASTLLRRSSDWIALTLCDSGDCFSWGLAVMTAPSPEGPWSLPTIVLSVDTPDYYPAPVEFYPCFAADGIIYAPATSVAASRNYQAVFASAMEEAHKPDAWQLQFDGNAWHSRPSEDEKYGIWGQTFHGFVQDGRLNVMYPSKNGQNYGTLFVASRPWRQPLSDGFTLSAHVGKSIAPLLAGYADFELQASFTLVGTIDIAFDYAGLLGPHGSVSDAVPHPLALANYKALRISDDNSVKLVSVDADGSEHVLASASFDAPIGTVRLRRSAGRMIASNGDTVFADVACDSEGDRPLALIAHEWSNFACRTFELRGNAGRYELGFNSFDALLGAGQRAGDWTAPDVDASLFRSGAAFIGRQQLKAKWNVIGSGFELHAPTSPDWGKADVYVNGVWSGTISYWSKQAEQSRCVYSSGTLPQGRYGIQLVASEGSFPLDRIVVFGTSGAKRA